VSKLLVCGTYWGPKPVLPRVSAALLIKLYLPLPVDLVLEVPRVVWADVLRDVCYCVVGYSFPTRGIHLFTLHSGNHQEWEKGSKQAHDTYERVKVYNTLVN